ncbi:MAG: tetratricopeptide repeat protein [Cyanobacteria bacterium]|jgi:tetratricopeptide (TPR) repeat protein|nr:tetratricopeptide repeat protein [Cyanobacteria bacterium GSL.Bin1]
MAGDSNLLLKEVKQGNPQAIATLLNNKLSDKGIKAKVSVKKDSLRILFQSNRSLSQDKFVNLVHKIVEKIEKYPWNIIKIYGQKIGEEVPDWVQEIKLGISSNQSVEELAKQGDINAISSIISQTIKLEELSVKVSIKDQVLKIMLEAQELPDQEKMTSQIQKIIQELQIANIQIIQLYGKETSEDFPDWHQEIKLEKQDKVSSNQSQESAETESIKDIDEIALSNEIYKILQNRAYEALNYRLDSEDDKPVKKLVKDFITDLEVDLRDDLEKISKEVIDLSEFFNLNLEEEQVKSIISNCREAHFSQVKLAIKELDYMSDEVIQLDISEDEDVLKNIWEAFSWAEGNYAVGIGTVVGSFIAPGIGTMIGGAIGGWLGGQQKEENIQRVVENYQNARNKLFQVWNQFLGIVYENLKKTLQETYNIDLLTYERIEQALDYYTQANECLDNEEKIQDSIPLYDKAIQLNPKILGAWNNKGIALNQLGRYQEAVEVLNQGLKIDETADIIFANLGDAFQGLGDDHKAIQAYDQCVALSSDNHLAWMGKADSLYNLRNYNEAIQIWEKLIILHPEAFICFYKKASCLAAIGNSNQAIEALKQAVNINADATQQLIKENHDFDDMQEREDFKILMESSLGIDYASLKRFLNNKQWKEADQETARLIAQLVEKTNDYKAVEQNTLRNLPQVDINTIDQLWLDNSDHWFGFSVQKKIYEDSSLDRNQFGVKTGWRFHDDNGTWYWRGNFNFDYNFDTAPQGHLPSSLWAGEDGFFENRRDRLITIFSHLLEK